MMAGSSCGLSADGVADQASWQAYIALTLSSIESTIKLPKKSILIIRDRASRFKADAVCVKETDAHDLRAEEEETEIENVIWDGEALLETEVFNENGYGNHGMMLLRNRFFKTCAFNTNLQDWFFDNDIEYVSQLAGYTTARDIKDIKLVITESSVKYLKFMPKDMMLHEALDAAVKERLIVRNPTNGTTVPKPNYPDKQVLDDGQLEKFLGMIEAYPDWRDFFYTECMTGLRRGEICGLKWSDIDFENRRLRVERSLSAVTNGKIQIGETKTGAGKRTIVLPPTLAALLAKRKENALNEWVFYNPCNPNLPMNPAAAYQKLHTILKNAELPRIRFHDLRHTFATHATKGGVDPKTLSGILGHTNASFTLDTYTHVTGDMQKNAAAIVGGMVKKLKLEDE